jgi:hypothetical protein
MCLGSWSKSGLVRDKDVMHSATNEEKIRGKKKNGGKEPKSAKFRSHTYRYQHRRLAPPPPIFEEFSMKTRNALADLGVCSGH